uniref:Uncharacterized protein n=1 Tax=Seriola lalandi dorsalis TaxID=1841481 RepID=A0A3B4WIU4_SERLL
PLNERRGVEKVQIWDLKHPSIDFKILFTVLWPFLLIWFCITEGSAVTSPSLSVSHSPRVEHDHFPWLHFCLSITDFTVYMRVCKMQYFDF